MKWGSAGGRHAETVHNTPGHGLLRRLPAHSAARCLYQDKRKWPVPADKGCVTGLCQTASSQSRGDRVRQGAGLLSRVFTRTPRVRIPPPALLSLLYIQTRAGSVFGAPVVGEGILPRSAPPIVLDVLPEACS